MNGDKGFPFICKSGLSKLMDKRTRITRILSHENTAARVTSHRYGQVRKQVDDVSSMKFNG
jgi:hypothetical protein